MVTITVTVEEGTLVYLGARPDGSANWRMLKRGGKGTMPVPNRLTRKIKRYQQEGHK